MNLSTLMAQLAGLWAVTPEALTSFVDNLALAVSTKEVTDKDSNLLRGTSAEEPLSLSVSGGTANGYRRQMFSGSAPEARIAAKSKSTTPAYEMDGPVAIIPVKGTLAKNGLEFFGFQLLTSMRDIGASLRQAAADPAVRAIMLDVESPGGTVDGIEELAASVAAAGQSKPLYAYADGLMASAAYWASCGARSIGASSTAQVGSIGVVLMHREVSKALDNAGIKVNFLTAGRYKAAGNQAEPLTDEMRAYMQSNIDDVYGMFLSAVEAGRGVSREKALSMADGKIFLAGQAQTLGLIDRVCSRSDFINNIKGDCNMTLTELKAQHPEAVQALRDELRVAVSAEVAGEHEQALGAARAEASAAQANVIALVGAIFGKAAGEQLQAIAATGVSAEMLGTLQGVLGQSKPEGKVDAQQQALDALKGATAKVPASALDAVASAQGQEEQDFEALLQAHMDKHSCSKGAAMAAVAKANPEAHQKWIAARNAARKEG